MCDYGRAGPQQGERRCALLRIGAGGGPSLKHAARRSAAADVVPHARGAGKDARVRVGVGWVDGMDQ